MIVLARIMDAMNKKSAPGDIAELNLRVGGALAPELKRTLIIGFFCAKPWYAIENGFGQWSTVTIPDTEVGKRAKELWVANGGVLGQGENDLEMTVKQACFTIPILV